MCGPFCSSATSCKLVTSEINDYGGNITYAAATNLWNVSLSVQKLRVSHGFYACYVISASRRPVFEARRHARAVAVVTPVTLSAQRSPGGPHRPVFCGLAHSQKEPAGVVWAHVCQVLHPVQAY